MDCRCDRVELIASQLRPTTRARMRQGRSSMGDQWLRFSLGLLTAMLIVEAGPLSGCATAGHRFNMEAVSKLQPGVTTEPAAIELLGAKPTHRQTHLRNGNPPTWEPGDYFLGWVYVEASVLAGSRSQSLLLMFNKAGILKEIVGQSDVDGT